MTLTEQWKNGELEWDREYYVDLENNGKVKQLYLDEDGCFFDGIVDYSLKSKPYMEVLAPVPSYEKYKELEKEHNLLGELCERLLCIEEKQWENIIKTKSKKQQIEFLSDKTKFSFLALFDENQQLKELLKECVPYVNHRFMRTRETLTKPYTASDKVLHKKAEKLLTKIDNAIGEK